MAKLEEFSGKITNGSVVEGVNWGQIGEAIEGGEGILGIVLSNSCDFENHKIGFVIVAGLVDAQSTFTRTKEFKNLTQKADGKSLSQKQKEKIKDFFENAIYNTKASRYYTVYPAKEMESLLPVLAVDFQMLVSIPLTQIESLEGVAELRTPYREEMMHRFTAYTGRVPVEIDAQEDIDNVVKRLAIDIL